MKWLYAPFRGFSKVLFKRIYLKEYIKKNLFKRIYNRPVFFKTGLKKNSLKRILLINFFI